MKRTPWFKPNQKPVRPGLYEAQDTTMRCNGCVTMLEWRDGEWFSRSSVLAGYRTHFWPHQLRRWRGVLGAATGKEPDHA